MNDTALLARRKGLIMGIANDHSIAYGIARTLRQHGADLAFTYQTETLARRVRPLAEGLGGTVVLPCDVEDEASIDGLFAALRDTWGQLDFVIHAIAYSDRDELKGRYLDTTRANFLRTMQISCFSFTEVAQRAAPLMPNGGSLLTLSFAGSTRVMPHYNVMGLAKAALESSVRYLAADLGRQNIRVNALSPGPMRTLSGSVISNSRYVYRFYRDTSPLRRTVGLDEIGNTALYLVSDLSTGITGDVLHIDGGFHSIGVPLEDTLANVSLENASEA